MTFDITQIVVALIGLLATVITAAALPWIKSKLGAQRWEQMLGFVSIAVRAAEQLHSSGQGEEKLQYALGCVKAAAAEAGLSYDEATIRAAIEAAVLGLR